MTFQEDPSDGIPEFDKAAADVEVRAVLATLMVEGRLTPNAVVEAARAITSPLHRFFTWDDAEAAEAHRREQARKLIGRIKVVELRDDVRIVTPLYVRDVARNANEQGYRLLDDVVRDPEMQRPTMRHYLAQAKGNLTRAVEIATALGYGDDCAKAVVELDKLMRRLS